MLLKQQAPSRCPCESGTAYDACCGRWHAGAERLAAPTAEALMRSRYSAFAMDLLDYLLETWHPDTRPEALSPNPPGTKWLGLRITSSETIDECHAQVAFVARSRLNGRAARLVEKSRFVKEHDRWLYIDGEIA
jgi:SEC-C motif-containing protein